MEITSCENKIYYAIDCMICGESTPFAQISSHHYQYAICDKCKKAVLYVRKQMEDKVKSKTSPVKLSKKSLEILEEKNK